MSTHSKLTKHLITKDWNKQFMKLSQATGSKSNLNKSKLLTFKSRKQEFSVESVQYLILKLLIFANTIVRMSQNPQIVKSSSYFWRWIHQERCRTESTLMTQLTGENFVNVFYLSQITFKVGWSFWKMMLSLFSVRKFIQYRQEMDSPHSQ